MKAADTLVTLAVQFALMSLLAFGGANSVIPEMHRQAVDLHHWMTGLEFAALFAISQAAPGPNFMISTLIGWKAAGLPGALVATLALCAPSCLGHLLGGQGVGPRAGSALAHGDPGRHRAADRRAGHGDGLSAGARGGPQLAARPRDRDSGDRRLSLQAQSPFGSWAAPPLWG